MIKQTIAMPYYKIVQPVRASQGTVTQIGTDDPTPGYLNNEIEGITWERMAVGNYKVTWPGFATTVNTIMVQVTDNSAGVSAWDNGTGGLIVETWNTATGVLLDGVLTGATFEIKAYPAP